MRWGGEGHLCSSLLLGSGKDSRVAIRNASSLALPSSNPAQPEGAIVGQLLGIRGSRDKFGDDNLWNVGCRGLRFGDQEFGFLGLGFY